MPTWLTIVWGSPCRFDHSSPARPFRPKAIRAMALALEGDCAELRLTDGT
jgi:hypothetical protein